MRLIFCGTPEFAVPTLEAVLAAGHEVALVLSQPDRPTGRKQIVEPTPVKAAALRHNIEVLQPEKIKRNEDLRTRLEAIAPDAILVVAYGRIIPDWMLALPPHGCINLHGSLLPKYRGAAPIQWAIARGETHTGVTTMRLDSGLDTGPMLLAQVVRIAEEETAVDLFESLADIGSHLMVKTLHALECRTILGIEQDHSAATLAPILTREDGRMDLTLTAQELYNRWRGFQPWPGAFTTLRGKKLIIHRMALAKSPEQHGEGKGGSMGLQPHEPNAAIERGFSPGELLIDNSRLFLACATNLLSSRTLSEAKGEGSAVASCLELLELQLEGKTRMSAADFLRGHQLQSGERLGQ